MQTAIYFDKQQVMLTNSKLCWQTASYFDKQQVILTSSKLIWQAASILTNSKLFWQAASYFLQTVSNVILTNSKLFWQTVTNFDKQQTNCKLIYKQWSFKNFAFYTRSVTYETLKIYQIYHEISREIRNQK